MIYGFPLKLLDKTLLYGSKRVCQKFRQGHYLNDNRVRSARYKTAGSCSPAGMRLTDY